MNVTIDGADADGKPHPITGDATSDARSVRKIDDHTLGAPRRPRTLPVFAHEAMSPVTCSKVAVPVLKTKGLLGRLS